MMTPVIRLVAYESRDSAKIFAAVPDQRGRYVLTDRSVAMVACPSCKAMVGEPCKSRLGYAGGTHYTRRGLANGVSNKPHAPDILGTEAHKEEPLEFPELPEA